MTKKMDVIYERSTEGKLDSQADALRDLVFAHWKKGPKFGSKIDHLHNWYQTEYVCLLWFSFLKCFSVLFCIPTRPYFRNLQDFLN